MNHLESSFTGKNNFWRYLVMLFAILAGANTLGSIPLILSLVKKMTTDPGAAADFSQNPGNLSLLGIEPNLGLLIMLLPFLAGLFAFILLIKPIHVKLLIW